MRLPRPRKPREQTEHDRTLLALADTLDDDGDTERAAFVRGLVAERECDLLDELKVRRWVREVRSLSGDGYDDDPEWREYRGRWDRWQREGIAARGVRDVGPPPRPPSDRLSSFPWPDVPGSAGEG